MARRPWFGRTGRVLLSLSGVAFSYLAYVYLSLPDVRPLARTNPPTTAFMQLRIQEARNAGRKFSIRQRWIPYGQISPNLRRAVIVTEDAAFFDHDGIDLNEIRASFEKNWEEGALLRGGSTITQQLAKNLYLSPSKNPTRKLTELLIARRLEAAMSKRRIFELYLNLIEWGDGIFGCEAAAERYFGVHASELNQRQALLLAAVIINPRKYSVLAPQKRIERRVRMIAGRLRRLGYLDDEGYRLA